MSGICALHVVDGRVRSAEDCAGGHQSAARLSARSCGAHVRKRFRRRQRRAGLLGEGGTAPPTQGATCDPQGACRPVEEWAGVASRLSTVPPLGARFPGRHQEWSSRHTDKRLLCGVRLPFPPGHPSSIAS
ncbi:hypothetical protein TcCL_NonESM04727 [Trypanosoma cruzi]|nr:hypothetical protein TcCL_NonESM04727 [Trypanosoma cruzi]